MHRGESQLGKSAAESATGKSWKDQIIGKQKFEYDRAIAELKSTEKQLREEIGENVKLDKKKSELLEKTEGTIKDLKGKA
jgi:hypothetical protein